MLYPNNMTLKLEKEMKQVVKIEKLVKKGYFQHAVSTMSFFPMLSTPNLNYFALSFYLN